MKQLGILLAIFILSSSFSFATETETAKKFRIKNTLADLEESLESSHDLVNEKIVEVAVAQDILNETRNVSVYEIASDNEVSVIMGANAITGISIVAIIAKVAKEPIRKHVGSILLMGTLFSTVFSVVAQVSLIDAFIASEVEVFKELREYSKERLELKIKNNLAEISELNSQIPLQEEKLESFIEQNNL